VIAVLLTFSKVIAWIGLLFGGYVSAVVLSVTTRERKAATNDTERSVGARVDCVMFFAASTVPIVSFAWIVATWGVS
jgi:hypothetical protein